MILELAILKNFDADTYKAGVQLAGSLTTYFDDVPVSRAIPTSALVIGNRVILAIPGDNPKDACVIATWPQGTPGGGTVAKLDDIGDVSVPSPADDDVIYWDESAGLWKCKAISGMEVHGNEYHDPDFATEATLSSHASAATGVHGVGAGTIAKVGDIAVDSNLSSVAQDTIAKKHTQNTDKTLVDADNDTKIQVEKTADEDKIHMDVKGVEAFLLDAAGVLTLAKQSNVRAYRVAQQTITTNTWTKVQLTNKEGDPQSEFDNTTNYRFTVKTAGTYIVSGVLRYNSGATAKEIHIAFYKNGSLLVSSITHTGCTGACSVPGLCTLTLSVNDYIELWAWHNVGSSVTIDNSEGGIQFSITKML
jgi:hypothetical protein